MFVTNYVLHREAYFANPFAQCVLYIILYVWQLLYHNTILFVYLRITLKKKNRKKRKTKWYPMVDDDPT